MAELTLTAFVSLDGVMQAPGGPEEDGSNGFRHGGWLVPHFDDEVGKFMDGVFSKVDAFLLGRTTYDIFAAYWPQVTDPADQVAAKLNSLPKFVASRTRSVFSWGNTTHVSDVVREVAELKRRFEREVQVHGSAGLAQTLIGHDLVDTYRLLVFPVVLGTGKRLFESGTVPRTLKLISANTTGKGAIISIYRPAGRLLTGTYGIEAGREKIIEPSLAAR